VGLKLIGIIFRIFLRNIVIILSRLGINKVILMLLCPINSILSTM